MNRRAGLEILRILAMCLIIFGHYIGNSDGAYIPFIMLYPLCQLGLLIFIIISCWFLIDSKFKFKRLLVIYLEMVFYGIAFWLVLSSLNKIEWSFIEFLKFITPPYRPLHMYGLSYMYFLCLLPLLNFITRRSNKWVRLIFASICIAYYYVSFFLFKADIADYLLLMIIIYFICSCIKAFNFKINPWISLTTALISISMLCYGRYLFHGQELFTSYLGSTLGILMMLGGFGLFFAFKDFNIPSCKILTIAAQPTLAILIVHINDYCWIPCCALPIDLGIFTNNLPLYCLMMFLYSMLIYVVFGAIDLVRKYALEVPLMKLKPVKWLCSKVDSLLDGIDKEPEIKPAE